ncbi:glycogen synthase [Sphingobacterium sp. HJSM2_6]|uniref:glycogen synthase n=1 Tax=Sphingobacterium sp. HJSM2_6 TaxID=3366264 RepID=UPI003BDB3021
MKVIHLSVECFPVAKVGGLADVVGALPKYLRNLGVDASLIMPFYDRKFTQEQEFDLVAEGTFFQGSNPLTYEVLKEKTDILGFPLYLIRIVNLLDRAEIYCYPDEAEQWIAFQHACLHYLKVNNIQPDIIHCHDHHVGLIPFLTKHSTEFNVFASVKTVFTVHNGQYQGWMNWNKGIILPGFDTWKWGLLDWGGLINPLATAIKCCDAYTTVSEGYLTELYQEANGLQDLFFDERGKSTGIVNGIDVAYWDPAIDRLIPSNYQKETVEEGKYRNKLAITKEYQLDPELPLISYIGRFAAEKGADLLAEIVNLVYDQHDGQVNIFILGSGDELIQEQISQLKSAYQKHLAVYFGYNEQLAHQLYAASDMLLMPSRVEPCGLNQLYALKYGTIPVVRKIGGLKDTVIDLSEDGYGFVFDEVDAREAALALDRAIGACLNKDILKLLRQRAMELDFSWDRSASKYIELYNQLLK